MKKEKLELLLNKLSTSYNAIIIKIILLKDEELLNILVDINEVLFDEAIDILSMITTSIEYKKNALNFLKNNTFKNEFNIKYACDILKDTIAIKEGFAIDGGLILAKSKTMFSSQVIYDILFDKNLIKEGINILGAKIISEADEEYKAYYASFILKDPTISPKIKIMGANIINISTSMYNAKEAYEEIIIIDEEKNTEEHLNKAKEKATKKANKTIFNTNYLKEMGFIDALNKYPEGSDINLNEFLKEVRPDFVKAVKITIEAINPKFGKYVIENKNPKFEKDLPKYLDTGISKKRKRFNRK